MRSTVFSLVSVFVIAAAALGPVAAAAAVESPLPAGWRGPVHLAFAPDGKLWMTLEGSWALGAIDVANDSAAIYPFPTPRQGPRAPVGGIAFAPDGMVWTGTSSHLLGLSPANASYLAIPLPVPAQLGGDLYVAKDGAVWYALVDADVLVRRDPATGELSRFGQLSPPFGPIEFHEEPDGTVFLTGTYGHTYGRFDPVSGRVDAAKPVVQGPVGIDGRDGELWIAEMGGSSVSRVDVATGAVERFPTTPSPFYPISGPSGILVVEDGVVWFVEHFADRLSRLDTKARTLHEYQVPSAPGTNVQYLARGPDGTLWFGETSKDRLGTVTFGGEEPPPAMDPVTVPAGGTRTVQLAAAGSKFVVAGPGPSLQATLDGQTLTLKAAPDASGQANVLVAYERGGDRVGRYLTVTIGPAEANETPGVGIAALVAVGALALAWRRRR